MASARIGPLRYDELKPYYELLELELPVSGPAYFPWGDPHGYAFGPHPMGGVGDMLIRGCTQPGHSVSRGRPSRHLARFTRRSAPLHLSRILYSRLQGRRKGEHSDHSRAGCDRATAPRSARTRMVSRVYLGNDRRVTGVTYFDHEGREHFQKAKAVVVCRLFDRDATPAAKLRVSGV